MTRRERRRLNRERARKKNARRSSKRYRTARAKTYGPARFEDHTDYVRSRGRRSLNKGKSRWRRKSSTAGKSRKSSRSSSRRTTGWSSDYALGRAWGVRAPKGMRKKQARRYVAKQGMRKSRAAAGRRLTYNELMKALSGTKLKAWVCAGPKRTGCGGGRKRYGGSRQIGVLRP